jgi:hypothetical protein
MAFSTICNLKLKNMLKKSQFGKLNAKDIVKGAIVAAGTTVLTGVGTALESGVTPNKLQIAFSLKMGLFAALSYLFKNILTNSKDETFTTE